MSCSVTCLPLIYTTLCSTPAKIERLLAEQRRIAQELAELRKQDAEFINVDAVPDQASDITQQSTNDARLGDAINAQSEDTGKAGESQEFETGKGDDAKEGVPRLPPGVKAFFEGAGVLDKMDTTPRILPLYEETGPDISDALRVSLIPVSLWLSLTQCQA